MNEYFSKVHDDFFRHCLLHACHTPSRCGRCPAKKKGGYSAIQSVFECYLLYMELLDLKEHIPQHTVKEAHDNSGATYSCLKVLLGECVKHNKNNVFPFSSPKLKIIGKITESEMLASISDYDWMQKMGTKNGYLWAKYTPKHIFEDKDLFIQMVQHSYDFLRYFPESLKNDEDVCRVAVQNWRAGLTLVSPSMQNNKGLVLEAVKSCGFALEYASEALRDDDEVVFEAVKNCGLALKFASPRLRRDKRVCSAAVFNNVGAREFML